MDRYSPESPRFIPLRPERKRGTPFCDQHLGNRIVAKIIPVVLVGAAGFATWVYIAQVCINFLIKYEHNTGLGAALVAIYLVLLLLLASCFFRLVLAPAGYVPRGKDDPEKTHGPDHTITADIFVCDPGGQPRWCRVCENIKPDRAHHSRDSQRCVYKMDHFCPWVGGMVGFTRYKFFLQFVTYTALFCCFVVASMAPLMPRRLQNNTDFPTTWIITLVLAGFFALFMIPFSITHIYYTLQNITTNESFDHKTRTYLFNVLVLDGNKVQTPSSLRRADTDNPSSSARVIVSSDPGDPHPWDVGWRRNWQHTMGEKVWDWFLPIHGSMGDGIRFEYNKNLVEKLLVRARKSTGVQVLRPGPLSMGSRQSPYRQLDDGQGSSTVVGTPNYGRTL